MEIIVRDTNAAEGLMENYKIQWELRVAKLRSKWLLYYFGASLMVIAGILASSTEGIVKEVKLDRFDLNPFLISIGIVLALFTFQYQLAWRKQHKFNIRLLGQEVDLLKNNTNESILTFTDEYVLIEQHEKYDKIGWAYFNYYTVHKNLLILHKHPMVIENIVVDKNVISQDEFDELLFFVSQRLKPFKI